MCRALPVVVILAALAAQTARGDNREVQYAAEIQKLTPELQTVATGGRWLRGSAVGTFRLLVCRLGFEFHRDQAFLQWIRLADDATQSDVVERTIPITEIHGIVVSHRFARTRNGW